LIASASEPVAVPGGDTSALVYILSGLGVGADGFAGVAYAVRVSSRARGARVSA
jgi:hypothetical protein